MTRLFFFWAALLLAPACARAQSVQARLDEYMTARSALGLFSGAVLVARHDTVLLSKGYGYANFELGVPNTARTKFQAASITKQFVALAILQLRDAGKLSLSDSICKYVADCPSQWAPVTIDHLARHSSGVPDYEEPLELGSDRYLAYMVVVGNADSIVAAAKKKPLDFPPGTKFSYSNTAYILLSHVIEKASGMKYADLMRERIFKPAGMIDTQMATAVGFIPNQATGYTTSGDTPLDSAVAGIPLLKGTAKPVPWIDVSGLHGDGGIVTYPADLFRWIRAHSGTALGRRETIAEAFRPGLVSGDTTTTGYAYGWFVGSRFGKKQYNHTGFLPGFASKIDYYPETGVVVIGMANLDNARHSRISRDLGAIAHGLPYDLPRSHRIVPPDSAALRAYVGEYQLADSSIATVKIGDRYLELAIPRRFTAGLLPESSSLFYVPLFEGTVEFKRDAAGKVVSLNMHYDGVDHIAVRR
jgi:CubicO group peptidase (beta-lactamase class C family)